MKIKFDVKFSYDSVENTYKAEIQLFLPCNITDNSLNSKLLSNKEIFGERLKKNWGNFYDNKRKEIVVLEKKSLNELEVEVRIKIREVEETLRRIYEENIEKFNECRACNFEKEVIL